MQDTDHIIYRNQICYSRHSDRGLEILKQEYEQAIRQLMNSHVVRCFLAAVGVAALSVNSFS